MIVAEALARRKDLAARIETLSSELVAAATHYEDEDGSAAEYAAQRTELTEAAAEFERLTVAINRGNNRLQVSVDGETMTMMEAIARRDRLHTELRHARAIRDGVNEALGRGRRRGWSGGRSKDDVRVLPTIEPSRLQDDVDHLSAQIRRLDLEIQKVNWSSEL